MDVIKCAQGELEGGVGGGGTAEEGVAAGLERRQKF